MNIVDVVYVDRVDGYPETQFPARNGGEFPVKVSQVIKSQMVRRTVQGKEYDYPIYTVETESDVKVKGVLKVYDEEDTLQLLEEVKRRKLEEITEQYENSVAQLEEGYPAPERESWFVQVEEAQAFLAAGSEGKWIEAAAASRGCTVEELAGWILSQNGQYRVLHGTLTGHRQLLRDRVWDSEDFQTLLAIKWNQNILDPFFLEPEQELEEGEVNPGLEE